MLIVVVLNAIIVGLGAFTFGSAKNFEKSLNAVLRIKNEEIDGKILEAKIFELRTSLATVLLFNTPENWEHVTKTRLETEDLAQEIHIDSDDNNKGYIRKINEFLSLYEQSYLKIKNGLNEGILLADPSMQDLIMDTYNGADGMEKYIHAFSTAEEEESKQEVLSARDRIQTLIFGGQIAGILSIFLGLSLWFVLKKIITAPFRQIISSMKELADGNLDVKVPAYTRNDEITDITAFLEFFRIKAIKSKEYAQEIEQNVLRTQEMLEKQKIDAELIREKAKQVEDLEEQKKREALKVQEERKKEMNKMADVFEKSVMDIAKIVSSSSEEIHVTAEALAINAQEATDRTSMISDKMEKRTDNMQSIASAAEELSMSISEISGQVLKASGAAKKATTGAQKTNQIITALSKAIGKIDNVIQLISNIADKTNLLALNATIEAARAGDAGRGFSVVANEVKALANQTTVATDEIRAQVATVEDGAQKAVEAVQEIEGIINIVQVISETMNGSVSQQEAATQEIAKNIQLAADGSNEISKCLGDAASGATTNGVAAMQVLASVKGLAQNASQLHDEVSYFLKVIRTEN